MKQLKFAMSTTALTLALSFSAFAGQMDTGFVDIPPQTESATTASSQSATVNPLTQVILALLNLLPKV